MVQEVEDLEESTKEYGTKGISGLLLSQCALNYYLSSSIYLLRLFIVIVRFNAL